MVNYHVNDALRSVVSGTSEFRALQAMASERGCSAIPFDSHAANPGAIEVGFMQNFAPNKRGEIAEQRLLYLHRDSDGAGRDGYPYERCWMVLYRLVVQIAVQHYGLDAGVAKLLVMATVAVLNRTVFDGPPTWASNS